MNFLRAGVVRERADLAVVVVGVVERRRHLPDRERLGGVRLGAVDASSSRCSAASRRRASAPGTPPARAPRRRRPGRGRRCRPGPPCRTRRRPRTASNREQRGAAQGSGRPRTAYGVRQRGPPRSLRQCPAMLPLAGPRSGVETPHPALPGPFLRTWPGTGVDAARSGASSGSPATIRSGTTPAHTVSSRSSGSSSPYPSLTLTDHSSKGRRRIRVAASSFFFGAPQLGPPAREEVLGQPLEGGQLLVVRHRLGDPEHGRAAVVHARLERRPRVDQPVQVHDVHAHRRPVRQRPHQPARGRAVQQQAARRRGRTPSAARTAARRSGCRPARRTPRPGSRAGRPGRRPASRAVVGRTSDQPAPVGSRRPQRRGDHLARLVLHRARCSGPWNDSA